MAKVLVVDDSLSVRKVVERALVGRQIEVVCAATGDEALERIEREEPDVVVCDVVMPDRDGYEICDFVKRHPRLSRTPVLLMSGIVNDDVRARAARVQSADVLSKPFAADDLLRRLEALLAAATPPPPAPPVEAIARPEPAPRLEPAPRPEAPRIEAPARPETSELEAPSRAEGPAPPVPLPLPAPALNGINGHARSHAEPPAAPASGAPAAGGTAAILRQFAAIDGVQWAVLADREGFLLDASAEDVVGAEAAGALSSCLAESSEGLGRELGRGALHGMILEYEHGMVVLYGVGASALLAIALGEPSVLGKVRYFAKKAVPELLQAL
jgi:CheY-like chemotaxis protein/predicted regulator of Ras-like GTPase activity (Roadblock/LC7/MglB family)